MSTSKYEQLTTWFDRLGGYLGSFILPDISEYDFDIGQAIADGTEEWTAERAKEFDDAVDRYNKEQKRKREAEAAEELAVERAKIISEAHQQLQAVRPLPTPEQTVVLAANIVDAAGKRIAAANDAYRQLVAAKDAQPTNFAKATETALAAIRSATTAAEELTQAIAAEARRRTQALEELTRSAATAEGTLAPDAKPPLVPEKQNCLKNLKAFIEKKVVQLGGLTKIAGTATPEEFKLAGDALRETIGGIAQSVEVVNSVAVNNRKKEEQNKEKAAQEQRGREIEDLRWNIPLPSSGQLAVLTNNKPALALVEAKKTYDGAFGTLQTTPVGGFEAAKTIAADAYARLERANQEATRAISTEIAGREDRRKELQAQAVAADSTAVGPEPLPGTAEATQLQDARRSYRDLSGQLATAKETATPGDFVKLAAQVADAVKVLAQTRRDASDATRGRLLEVARLKSELTVAANAARPKLPTGPTPTIVQAATGALDCRLSEATALIDGKDPVADAKVVQEFTASCVPVEALGKNLGRIQPVPFATVAGSEIVKATITKLLEPLNGKEGIGPTAVNLADTLSKDVARVAERYAEIAALVTSYTDVLVHPGFDQSWKAQIAGIPKLNTDKATLSKDGLGNGVKDCESAIRDVEKASRDRERRQGANAAHSASPEGLFLAYMDANTPQDIRDEFARLAQANTATCGAAKKSYVASSDDATIGQFSIEYGVTFAGGRGSLVLHFHCNANGTEAGGYTPSHFKRAQDKRGTESWKLVGAARNLRPAAGTILADR
jgi:hypothetical protein